MNLDDRALEQLRPPIAPLDPEWSHTTLARVMATSPRPARRRAGRRSTRRLVQGAAVTVAAAAAGVVIVPGLGPSAAYSVSQGNAGEITVEVRRLEDASGLQAALAEKGVTAVVDYLPYGQHCTRSLDEVVRGGLSTSVRSDHRFEVTLAPGTIRSGETLVIEAFLRDIPPEPSPDSSGVQILGGVEVSQLVEVVRGDPGPCDPT